MDDTPRTDPKQAAFPAGETEVGTDEMVVGRRYAVTFQDCCVEGFFTATLLHQCQYDDEPPCPEDHDTTDQVLGWAPRTVWDNGLTLYASVTAEATP
jgi:hypothetical protein